MGHGMGLLVTKLVLVKRGLPWGQNYDNAMCTYFSRSWETEAGRPGVQGIVGTHCYIMCLKPV